MAKMKFDVKCAKDCLVNNGIVFTVRSWEGYSALSKVEVDGVGLCTKKRIMRVSRKEDIAQYLSWSGFTSLDKWWAKIASFGTTCSGWLFEVRVIPSLSSLHDTLRQELQEVKCSGWKPRSDQTFYNNRM